MRITHLCVHGNTASKRGGTTLVFSVQTAAIAAMISFMPASPAGAQTTLTWATPGVNSDIANGGNWVGGTPPNFAGDATTDSAIFAASTNTTVMLRSVTTGDPFATVTFDAAAPAYTFTAPSIALPTDYNGNGVVDTADYVLWRNNPAGFGGAPGYAAWRSTFGNVGGVVNELVILPAGNITNNSTSTQTMTGIGALRLNGATDAPATLDAASGPAGTKLAFDVKQIKFDNPGSVANGGATSTSVLNLAAGFDVRTTTINGVVNGGISSSLYVVGETNLGTGGILHITGDSGTNPGRLVIDAGGIVRISHNRALGDPTLTVPATASTNQTVLLGGFRNGQVQLTGGLTINEGFTLNGRQGDIGITSQAILNLAGTNTLTGTFGFGGGGNAYNFGSEAGTLIIESTLNMTASAERYFTFQRAGNIVVNGNILSTGATGGAGDLGTATIVKYDSGTLTLNGTNNTNVGHFSIRGGTLALGANAQFTHVAIAGDTNYPAPDTIEPNPSPPRVSLNAGTTFDVTAKVGGYTLPISLEGHGTIKGTLNMASGTQVLPGALPIYDGQGMSINSFADAIGKLTFDGAGSGMNLGAGASYVWQLGAPSTSNPGVDFDQVVVGGNLALGGTSSIALDFGLFSDPDGGDPFWNAAHSWKIIDTTTNTGSTNFASIVNGTFSGGKHFTTSVGTGGDAGDVFLNYLTSGSGATLSLSAVPEPSTLLFVILGTLVALVLRKR